MADGGTRTVRAVATSCRILECLRERGGAGVTELAGELGVAKSAVHAHLATLVEHEFVVKEDTTYRLSLRYLDFAEATKERFGEYDVVVDEIDALAAETDEVANFGVEEHGRLVYAYLARGEGATVATASIGSRDYLHATALGKAILAHLPEDRVATILDRRGLPEKTSATITDRATLLAELETTRDRGYAVDDEEYARGVRCVALPVTGDSGEVIGAVSVSAPASRVTDPDVERFREAISEAVNIIELSTRFS